MVEEDKYCIDILTQVSAATKALQAVALGLLEEHLSHCVRQALAAANLGLALGSGTDVAICAADVILLRDDLACVPDAIRLSRATFATIHRNLIWAFGYNVAAIPLAALGLLNPVIAAAAMTMSSVFVVANSLRLQRYPLRAARDERIGRPHARLHPRQRQLPAAAAPDRRPGPGPGANGRGG